MVLLGITRNKNTNIKQNTPELFFLVLPICIMVKKELDYPDERSNLLLTIDLVKVADFIEEMDEIILLMHPFKFLR